MADPSVLRAVDDAMLDAEMAELMQNRPSFSRAVPGTNPDIESGNTRAVVSTAAEIPVWNRETGEQSIVIFDALRARMRQKFPADYSNPAYRGKQVYTMHPSGCVCGRPSCEPAPEPFRGSLACPLSPLHHDRAEVEALGYGGRLCAKPAYFQTDLDVDLHVEKSHKRFFEVRKRARDERERREAIDRQNQLTEALLRMAEAPKTHGKAAG
jgi:hypothetical protein